MNEQLNCYNKTIILLKYLKKKNAKLFKSFIKIEK